MWRIDIAFLLFTIGLHAFSVNAFFSLPHPTGAYSVDRSLARGLRADPQYKKLGGQLSSSPACMSADGRETHCFYVTKDGTVGYANVKNREAKFVDLGGSVKDQPQLVKYGWSGVIAHFMTHDGYIAVAAVSTDTEFDNKVTVLKNYGTFMEAPGCAEVESMNYVFCAARASNGGMYAFKFLNERWQYPYYVDTNPSNPLTCAYNKATSNVHCWSTDSEDILAERLFSENGLPVVPLWWKLYKKGRGRILVVMPNSVPFVRALERDGNEMIDIYGTFLGHLMSEPACTYVDSRSIDCFAFDEDFGLQRNYQQLGFLYVRQTSGWVHYGGKFVGKPTCTYVQQERKIHCFMRDPNNELVEGIFPALHSPRTVVT